MGSARETATVITIVSMADVSLLEPIQGLLDEPDLMGKMVETARLYWTNSFLTVNIFSTLFNGTILIMACLLFIYVFDLLSNSSLGQLMLQKKSYDVAAEEATYALGAILELQEQVAELQQHTFGGGQPPAREDQKASDPYQYGGGNPAYAS